MALGGTRQFINIIREVRLSDIKTEAEQRFDILVVGPKSFRQALAESLSHDSPATSATSRIHPWIQVLDVQSAGELQAWTRDVDPRKALAFLVTPSHQLDDLEVLALKMLKQANIPRITAVVGPRVHSLAGADLPHRDEDARALLAGFTKDEITAHLAPAVLELTPEGRGIRLSLARQLPALRAPIVDDLIEDVSRANATYAFSTGIAEIAPILNIALGAADLLVLTKNQFLMSYKIALASGRSGSQRELMGEIAGVLGGGLLFRQIARELVGLIPVIGLIPKVAVSYAGTKLIGRTVAAWADGNHLLEVDELRELYAEALSGGQELARKLRRSKDEA